MEAGNTDLKIGHIDLEQGEKWELGLWLWESWAPWWWLGPCPHNVSSPQTVSSDPPTPCRSEFHPPYSVDEELTGLEFKLRTFWPQSQYSCPHPCYLWVTVPGGGNAMCEVGRAELKAMQKPVEGEWRAGDSGKERAPRREREMSRGFC